MKKGRALALFAALAISICGCREAPPNIIHADGQDGFILEQQQTVTAAELPDIIPAATDETTAEDVTSEETSFDSSAEENVPTATTETPAAPETSEAERTTSTAALTPVSEQTTVTEATTPEQTEPVTSATTVTTAEIITPPSGTNSYRALNYDEVKGVWISYIELSSVLTGKTESQFTASIKQMYKNCADMGLNTVFVHVRSHGDAYYKSELYPWSKYVTGTIGAEPGFDPLRIMVEQAHNYGLSFQAWINPFRICSDKDISKVSEKYSIGSWYQNSDTRGDYVVKVGDYWYLNPGYKAVSDLIASGAAEIVANYDVDGVHIDDYFYPTTDASFDKAAFAASGMTSLSAFRLSNCDRMVSSLYKAVKGANNSALFGVSTQGNIDNNYNYMYADVEKWCKNSGYADYMAPQIYYGFKNSALSFDYNVSQWQKMLKGTGIKLIPGLAVYKIGNYDQWAGTGSDEWKTDKEILKRQVLCAREAANYGGVVFYSYGSLFEPTEHKEAVAAEKKAVEAILS